MGDRLHPPEKRRAAQRRGWRTSEAQLALALVAFAGVALYLGHKDVAMVVLASAGIGYPVSRGIAKQGGSH